MNIVAAPAEVDAHSDETAMDAAVVEAVGPTDAVEAPAEETPAEEAAVSETEIADEPVVEENGFEGLGLSPEVVRAVGEKGYRQPTPIQAQAIPTILMGRDVLGTAQTGTGKTGSFVLPMLDILSGARARARMPRSLILEPTRELALQVAENFVQYGKYLKLTHALLIGGESMADQKEALMRGVDVLIATPGRLMDLFERGGLLLTDTSLLVIDEADRMLDMGFIPDVEKIVGFLPERRQTLFFSATMAPEIRRLADAFLREPKEIAVSRPSSVATTIVAGLAVVDDLDKREALRRLIRNEDVQNALIFCNRKRDVDILYKSLKRHGFSVGSLHGDMSQPERFATLAKFKAGELRLLVCSDVAARGIDIGGLSHVFNFDVPIHAEDYVHRIGRTGRAGLTGHAYSLATPYDRGFVEAIEKLVGAAIPRIAVEGFDPVDFAEDDGKRRRGRGRTVAKPVKPKAKGETLEDATAIAIPVPKRRSRSKKPAAEPLPVDAPQPEVVEARAPELEPRERPKPRDRDRESRDRENRDRETRDYQARDRQPRDRDARRERYRRDDDLGPPVVGFGDDVPAFMLLRARAPRVHSSAEVD
ncbi:MAG: DEAD/DEAH box helicase [Acetobacteraceae bacterium]|nr:DEAD/DEAH box helicase [Acetobacteraceae bacterium]